MQWRKSQRRQRRAGGRRIRLERHDARREAGVRNLKREIINICRKLAREVVEKDIKKYKSGKVSVDLY